MAARPAIRTDNLDRLSSQIVWTNFPEVGSQAEPHSAYCLLPSAHCSPKRPAQGSVPIHRGGSSWIPQQTPDLQLRSALLTPNSLSPACLSSFVIGAKGPCGEHLTGRREDTIIKLCRVSYIYHLTTDLLKDRLLQRVTGHFVPEGVK